MRTNFEMFTGAGNWAVSGIVDAAVLRYDNKDCAWEWALNELDALGETRTYGEANDTAVREAVWDALMEAFPEAVFKSVRA